MVLLPALLFIGIFLPLSGEDVIDRMIPKILSRINEVTKAMVPVPEDQLLEGVFHVGTYYIPVDGESELCRNHSNFLFESYLNYDVWALKMVDASSKVPSGLLDGHFMDLGSYDQCLSVEVPGQRFRGQHCVVETKGLLPSDIDTLNPERSFFQSLRVDLMFSVCVPSSCSASDVKAHMDVTLNSINASAIVYDDSCTSSIPTPFTSGEWAALSVLALIVILVGLSTAYDSRWNLSEKCRLLNSFSLASNLPRLMDTHVTPAALPCLDGLRVLAMGWIILGHRMLFMLSSPIIRLKNVPEMIDDLSFAPVVNIQLAVEVFFLLSGILVAYNQLRCRQKGEKFNLLSFYLRRYLRMTPALAVMVLLHATLAIRVTDGPLWKRSFGYLQDFCQRNWWSTILYMSNYINPYDIVSTIVCMTQTWYVASDFQLYLFSPLLLVPLYRRPRLGLALTAVCLLLTSSAALWNAFHYELKGGGLITVDRRTEMNHVKDYVMTHLRAASFLIGIALGYQLFKIKQGHLALKLSKKSLCAAWFISLFLVVFSTLFVNVFQQPGYVYTPWLDSLYLVFHRHLFSIGLSGVIVMCTLGHGGVINSFLSWRVFLPLSRLTYCVFLLHVFLQNIQTGSERSSITFSLAYLWYHFAADFTISYAAAVILYLAVEAPFTNIINLLFGGKPNVQQPLREGSHLSNIKAGINNDIIGAI